MTTNILGVGERLQNFGLTCGKKGQALRKVRSLVRRDERREKEDRQSVEIKNKNSICGSIILFRLSKEPKLVGNSFAVICSRCNHVSIFSDVVCHITMLCLSLWSSIYYLKRLETTLF